MWEEENSILASDIIMEEIYEFFLVLDEVFASHSGDHVDDFVDVFNFKII